MAAKPRLAIIGGGASAVLLLAHMAREKALPESIAVFDRSGIFGRGVAYGTDNTAHLLNVRARGMSAYHTAPGHFAEWAEAFRYTPLDFVSRKNYALYLQDILAGALHVFEERGTAVAFIPASVTRSVRSGEIYKLSAQDQSHEADRVVLATGNAAPVLVPGTENLAPADGFHAGPWGIDYGAIRGDVLLLGTGLSAVDAVMALQAAGFAGNITAVSRHALLPAPHVDPLDYPVFIKAEDAPRSALRLLRLIRSETIRAGAQGVPWQAVIDSLRPVTDDVWQALPAAEREKLRRRLMSFWNIHRHRMPPQAAAALAQLREQGRLRLARDSVRAVEKTPSGLRVQGRAGSYNAAHVINCLGYNPQAPAGLEYTHALGPPLSGRLLETTAIPEIRAQACALAKAICR